jgi:serine/threonine protein kinase
MPRRNEQLDEYTIGGVIGKGSYAVVKSALCNANQQRVAIKVYDKVKLHDPMKKKNVQREIAILSKLGHPNIITLIRTIESPS